MKLLTLICMVALSTFGQTPAPSGDQPNRAANPQAQRLQAQTNQNLSAVQHAEDIRAACVQGRRSICGRILRVLPEGLIIESGYTNLMREPLAQSWLVPGTVTAGRAANLVEGREPDALCAGQVLITDLPRLHGAKLQLYDYVIIRGYPTGQYTYTSVGDIKKTVRRFSANLETATKLNFAAVYNPPPTSPAGTK